MAWIDYQFAKRTKKTKKSFMAYFIELSDTLDVSVSQSDGEFIRSKEYSQFLDMMEASSLWIDFSYLFNGLQDQEEWE